MVPIDNREPDSFILGSCDYNVGNGDREFGIFECSNEMMKTEILNSAMSLGEGNQGGPLIQFDNEITQITPPTPERSVELFISVHSLGAPEGEGERNGGVTRNWHENRRYILFHADQVVS
jgi:hypothetical protein